MPLGGPSFNQLISNLEQKAIADIVRDSTHYSHVFVRQMPDMVNRLWSRIGRAGDLNLEELLETIDYAAHDSQSLLAGEIIQEMNFSSNTDIVWNSEHISEISRLFRLRLAISTTSFLERIPDVSERWLPYKEWFRDLTGKRVLDFHCRLSSGVMGRKQHWAAVLSLLPLTPVADPHPASAAAIVNGNTYCSTIRHSKFQCA